MYTLRNFEVLISVILMIVSRVQLQGDEHSGRSHSSFGSFSRGGKCCQLDKQTSFEDDHSKQSSGPYFSLLPQNGFVMGRGIRIEGRVTEDPDSFIISLQRGQSMQPYPISAFHFNALYTVGGSGFIRLGAKSNGTWIKEQRLRMRGHFLPGSDFILIIVCGFTSYHVYVNEKLIAAFRYQVDPDIADTVLVEGDVQLRAVALENHAPTICTQRPSFNDEDTEYHSELEMPFYGLMTSSAFSVGKSIRIEGQAKLQAQYFHVNLVRGYKIWPFPTITLHINPRYGDRDDGITVMNSCYNGNWVFEEQKEIAPELYAARNFSLVIVRGVTSHMVYVNRKLIAEYVYRFDPGLMDTVYVRGDVRLWDVVVENFRIDFR